MAQVTQLGLFAVPMQKRPAFSPKEPAAVFLKMQLGFAQKTAAFTKTGKQASMTFTKVDC